MITTSIPQDIKIKPEQQPKIVTPIKQTGWNQTTYLPSYPKIAFDLLSKSTTAKNRCHLCAAFSCSKPTLHNWMVKNPEFKLAVEAGLEIGKSKWFSKLAKYAFKSTVQVNNGLIKLLSANIYGIRDDPEPVVIVNNNIESDPEQMMKKRGIPIPQIDIEDIEATIE